jgi:hypothetical protein
MLLQSIVLSQCIVLNSGFLQFTNEHNAYIKELLNHVENVINANFLFWSHDQHVEQLATLYHLKNITQLENLKHLFNKTREIVEDDIEEDFNNALKDQLLIYLKYLFITLQQSQNDMFDKTYFTKKLNSVIILYNNLTELKDTVYYEHTVAN